VAVQDPDAPDRSETAFAERLALAHRAGRLGTFEWDLIADRTVFIGGMDEVFGEPPGTLSGAREEWARRLYPGDRARVFALLEEVLARGVTYDTEYRIVWPDGSVHWIHARGEVFRDGQGRPLRLLGVNIDVTARRARDEELTRSEARFRRLFESDLFGVASGTPDGFIREANDYFLRLVGRRRDELPIHRDALVASERHPQQAREHAEFMARGVSNPVEKVYLRPDGTRAPALIGTAVVDGEGGREIVGYAVDITERRRAEDALRAEIARGEALVAELREALQRVKTLSGLLPICAWCHRVRDDQGYWERIEEYVSSRTTAEFTHGMCPHCAERLEPKG